MCGINEKARSGHRMLLICFSNIRDRLHSMSPFASPEHHDSKPHADRKVAVFAPEQCCTT
jgi:hypothetical protein